MEQAKYKILSPAITKAMIIEHLKSEGCTHIHYAGKNERFHYYDKEGEKRIYSKKYLINILINKSEGRENE